MADRLCKYDGCGRIVNAYGWCRIHWARIKKHGDPDAGVIKGTEEFRYWRHVIKGEGADCWGWKSNVDRHGYGRLGRCGRGSGVTKAHRVSWEIHFGPIPDGMLVLHKCDNPICSNPEHLRLGTHKDNTQDMIAKGRAGWQRRRLKMKKDLSPTHASEAPLTAKDKATKEHENHEMRRLGTTKDAHTEAPHAEEPGGQKVAETIVEHPLAPTDDRPNPQGDRDEPFVAVVTKEAPEYHMTKPDDGEGKGVEIENTTDRELHLGDGRVVHPGGRAKVSHDLAKSEGLKGKIKHV